MSAAAEAAAKAYQHPKVKGSRRALLETIATLIPEGQTMTRPIADDDLATRIGYDESTVLRARRVLVTIRAVRVVGGQGRVANYELLALPGAGADPSLPLIGRVKPSASRRPPSPDLFDQPLSDVVARTSFVAGDAIRADTVWQNARSTIANFWHFARSWSAAFWYFWRFARSVVKKPRAFCQKLRSVVAVDDARARDKKIHVRTHTHAPPAPAEVAPIAASPPRCRGHAWCDGRVHVPQFLHDEFQRKLQLSAAQLVAVYGEECAALAPEEPILEDDVTFWRRRFAARFARHDRSPPHAAAAPVKPPWCREHDPPCTRWTQHRERLLADARAQRAQERKSG